MFDSKGFKRSAIASDPCANVFLRRDQMSLRCGCMAKLGGDELTCMLDTAFTQADAQTRMASLDPEDATVLDPFSGRIATSLDFGPLSGPDAYRAGRIAAAHSMSDVYAMGGKPIVASAILVVDQMLPDGTPEAVMAGMIDGCVADDVSLVGGHTIIGPEALAGLSVIGSLPEQFVTKRGVKAGDRLMISKPLGSGMIMRAYRYGELDDAALEEALVCMEQSNRVAGNALLAAGVRAGTDVTGFGLLGHLAEMLKGGAQGAEIVLAEVPVFAAARDLPASFGRSSWIENNLQYCHSQVALSTSLVRQDLAPLLDPQTSGGLLIAAPSSSVNALAQAGFTTIGTVNDSSKLEVVA